MLFFNEEHIIDDLLCFDFVAVDFVGLDVSVFFLSTAFDLLYKQAISTSLIPLCAMSEGWRTVLDKQRGMK